MGARTVAFIASPEIWEDFTDTIGVSNVAFADVYVGSWMFGYFRALQSAGIRPVLFCISRRVTTPQWLVHRPTGTSVCLLPRSEPHRLLRRYLAKRATANSAVRRWLPDLELAAQYFATPVSTLMREVRRAGCDAILCQDYEYPRFDVSTLAGWLLRIPVFATFQGAQHRDLGAVETLTRSAALRACSGLLIGASDEARWVEYRHSLPRTKILPVPNPVDVHAWHRVDAHDVRSRLNIPPGAVVVVWHGRVEIDHKGLDVLADAWARICQMRSTDSIHLLLVGSGNDSAQLRQRVERLHLQNISWIDRFVHSRDEIRGYLSAGEIFVFPSRGEGFPVSPLEAMACGLAVVATDIPGVRDIFPDGEASGAMLIPSLDAESLSTALLRLAHDGELRRALALRARRRVERSFSLERVGLLLRSALSGSPDAACLEIGQGDGAGSGRLAKPLVLKALSPQRVAARAGWWPAVTQPRVVAETENAAPGTFVLVDGKALVTSYAGASGRQVTLPRSVLRRPGAHQVYLRDADRESNRLDLQVERQGR